MINIEYFANWCIASGEFDSGWYRTTFADIQILNMDPARHFRLYGAELGRAPNAAAAASTEHLQRLYARARADADDGDDKAAWAAARKLAAPSEGFELLAANDIALTGACGQAIHYARQHLPPEFSYTLNILQANCAILKRDEDGWLHHLNAYLAHFGLHPLMLDNAPTPMVDRLMTNCRPRSVDGPLVSVIMPAWNAEETIRSAIRSIQLQTWKNLEILVVDDASTDGTWRVLNEIAVNDDRIRIHRNKVNAGPYVSKNIALNRVNGTWITGHDADDWAHPERIQAHMREISENGQPKASLIHMVRMRPDGVFSNISNRRAFSFDGVARKAAISCMFHAGFLKENLGYWDTVRFGADSEMLMRVNLASNGAYCEFTLVGMICLELATSLTQHPVTGISKQAGVSSARVEYRDSWDRYLRQVSDGRYYLEFPQKTRKFDAPPEMIVPHEAIMNNIASLSLRLGRW